MRRASRCVEAVCGGVALPDLFQVVHEARKLLSLLLIEDLVNARFAGGHDFLHLRMEHLVVEGEVVESRFNLRGLFGRKLEFLLEVGEGLAFSGILPTSGHLFRGDGLGGELINDSASERSAAEYQEKSTYDLRIFPSGL